MKKYLLAGLSMSFLLIFSACKKDAPDMQAGNNDGNPPIFGRIGGPGGSGLCLGDLSNFLLVFTNGSTDANWQGATKGFAGNVAVNGQVAKERTSGGVPFGGVLFTNTNTAGAWEGILSQNTGQAAGAYDENDRISNLMTDLSDAFTTINGMQATFDYESKTAASLNGLNTQNGVSETYVINITSGMQVSSKIYITGDAGDIFILRWDADADPSNGYQGLVKFQSGGGIVPLGDLRPSNFVHVAGDISSSGGGSNPAAPYPQGPRYDDGLGSLITNGSNFNGGGFFTGYWLTTGDPVTGETHSLSNAIFVGGWYTTSSKFSMTSGTSGVYVSPPAGLTCE